MKLALHWGQKPKEYTHIPAEEVPTLGGEVLLAPPALLLYRHGCSKVKLSRQGNACKVVGGQQRHALACPLVERLNQ